MIVDLILGNKLAEAKSLLFAMLDNIAAKRLEEAKRYVADDSFDLNEANVIKMGRVIKIRRRIRRNKKNRIIVQRNVRKSAIKGYKLSGNTVKRISAVQRINKTRKLKRYWKTKGRAKLNRTLMKRKQSIRRRQSMGIR
jgi:phage anti-repressor protein